MSPSCLHEDHSASTREKENKAEELEPEKREAKETEARWKKARVV